MTETPPWEPPFAGSEVEHLVGALDRQRAAFRWKADGLDAAGLAVRVGASTLTLGGLLKHLASVEDHLHTVRLTGAPMGAPWFDEDDAPTDDEPGDDAPGDDEPGDDDGPTDEQIQAWVFSSAAEDSPAALYELYDGAVERSHARLAAVLERGGLDQLSALTWPDGTRLSVRRLMFDLLEEYGRHTGHADLLREAVDGRVGEDPPDDWRPTPT